MGYFTDVKIKNAPGKKDEKGSNIFQWRGVEGSGDNTNYPIIFELTDTGSNIGGWNITGDRLSSNGVNIIRTPYDTYRVSRLVSLSNYIKTSGGGSLGGCSVGAGGSGSLSIPDGYMNFGNKQVTLDTIKYVSSITIIIKSQQTNPYELELKGQDKDGNEITVSGTIARNQYTIGVAATEKQMEVLKTDKKDLGDVEGGTAIFKAW